MALRHKTYEALISMCIALLSSPSGFFNGLNAALFRRPRLARFTYPVLRAGRNTLLWLLGRIKIHVSFP